MNVDVQCLGISMTAAMSEHARRRLQFALTRRSHRIQRIVMRLGDENGPRGGVDKFCRIQVYLIDAPPAAIDEVGTDLYAVIDRAAERAGRVVAKHLDRARRDGRWHAAVATPPQHLEIDTISTPT